MNHMDLLNSTCSGSDMLKGTDITKHDLAQLLVDQDDLSDEDLTEDDTYDMDDVDDDSYNLEIMTSQSLTQHER